MAKQNPYVLARTFSESHAYAREVLGLSHGQYRVLTSASTIRSIRNVDLYLAPGWERRFDGHTIKSALRWTRMNVIKPEGVEAEAPDETPDGLEPAGVQPSLTEGADPALVEQFEAFLNGGEHPHDQDDPDGDNMTSDGSPVAPEPEQAEEPAPVEDKRRRSRCKECGVLVDPDEIEQHAAEHLTSE